MTRRLSVDRIACTGHGLCAELLPEIVDADEWGFPILATERVAGELLADAKAAVAACPVLALRLSREP
jgi:ferredoxin